MKEKVHILRCVLSCVINVRSLVSSICSRCWSRPPCPNLIGSVNLNQLVIQRQGEREKLKLRQLNAKLSQPRKQTQGERELPRPRQLHSEVTATDLAHITYQPPHLQLSIRGYNMHVSAPLIMKTSHHANHTLSRIYVKPFMTSLY